MSSEPRSSAFPDPVTPGATPEARALLRFLYDACGKTTLSGQHNQLNVMSGPSEEVEALTGSYPLVWGGEWGFSDENNDLDNVAYRPRLIEEIRAQHAAGRVVCVTYHQASPTVGEPCLFMGGVFVSITDEEYESILTDGTPLNRVWAEHVDRLAEAFKTLQSEGVPLVFRPYHEMNGGWFWWGGRPERFLRLWAMLYERYTDRHGLRNLLWAWNPDKPHPGIEAYLPGNDRVDLLGTDIYPREGKETYPQEWYDRMKALSQDKPLALSEFSELPDAETLARQPWAYVMSWGKMLFEANSPEAIRAFYDRPQVRSEPFPQAR